MVWRGTNANKHLFFFLLNDLSMTLSTTNFPNIQALLAVDLTTGHPRSKWLYDSIAHLVKMIQSFSATTGYDATPNDALKFMQAQDFNVIQIIAEHTDQEVEDLDMFMLQLSGELRVLNTLVLSRNGELGAVDAKCIIGAILGTASSKKEVTVADCEVCAAIGYALAVQLQALIRAAIAKQPLTEPNARHARCEFVASIINKHVTANSITVTTTNWRELTMLVCALTS